jgi:DMSO/TMAO reductase YedYZ molybdopterin-dependent catalytic subunit
MRGPPQGEASGAVERVEGPPLPRGREVRALAGRALLAAAFGVAVALLARLIVGLPAPAEIYGDRLTQLIPLPLFARLLTLFGRNAKHWYFAGLLVGEVLLTAAAGLLYVGLRDWALPRLRREAEGMRPLGVYDVPALALFLWLLAAGVLAPLIGGGALGAGLAGGVVGVFGSQLVPGLAFAAAFVKLARDRATAPGGQPEGDAQSLSRRRLLRQVVATAGVVGGAALLWNVVASALGGSAGSRGPLPALHLGNTPDRIVPPPEPVYGPWVPVAGQTPELTSAAQFYYVSKNLTGDPSASAAGWQLRIGGMVAAPYTLSYDALRALPQVAQYHTLECISNEVGGNLISTGYFTGTRLADVLNRAGIQAGASEVVFQALDGYSDSLHLSQALNPDSLIVYLLNGQPLPQAHGYPARLLIPGLYGMKNGKWLSSLTLGPGGYTGYWEQQGWTREARVKLMSRIDVPQNGDLLVARPMFIAGIAYAGDQRIARVDVSTDAGQSWKAATLRRPLGNLTWVLWEYAWTPAPGQYVLAVRAIDGQGNVQTPLGAPPLPDGASGYDSVSVEVR